MKSRLLLLIHILIASFPVSLFAQIPADSYFRETGNFALIYSGKLESGYSYGYINSPYYPQEYKLGSLYYKGMAYTDVSLRIDNYTCRLVIQSPDSKYNFPLNPSDVSRISIDNRSYVYLSGDSNAPNNAYYMVLHRSSDWGLYKLHYVSNVNKEYVGNRVLQSFSLKERIYLVVNGKWFEVNGRNSFISHFKQHKQELQHYCKQHGLHLSKENEEDWIRLALFCETLIK